MKGERIRIEGPAESLQQLRRELLEELGDAIEIDLVSTAVPGELREPIVIGLVVTVASTAGVAIKTFGAIVERRMTHTERMELLRIYRESDKKEISVTDLRPEELAP
jgi:hypothetical protein